MDNNRISESEDSYKDDDTDLIYEDLGVPIEELRQNAQAGALPDPFAQNAGDSPTIGLVLSRIEGLHNLFEERLKSDAQKERMIDQLHQELQEYKAGLIRQHIQTFFLDIVKVIDDIRKWCSYYQNRPADEMDTQKVLDLVAAIPSDLEDIFSYQGIHSFTCDGNTFDPSRQRVLKKIATADLALDKTVSHSIRPGYIWDERIIRPEMVAVYIHSKGPQEEQIDG